MKVLKYFLLILLFAPLSCQEQAVSDVAFNAMGFKFSVPVEWEKSTKIYVVPSFKNKSLEYSFYFLTKKAIEEKKKLERINNITPQTVIQICDKGYKLFNVYIFSADNFDKAPVEGDGWSAPQKIGENSKFFIYFAMGEKVSDYNKKEENLYKQYWNQSRNVEKTFEVFEPKESEQEDNNKGNISGVLSFSALDLQGEKQESKSLFSKNEFTLINIWGTYCGPCINEMPELAELDKENENFAVVGVVIDGESNIELAKNILKKSNATFVNLLPNSEIEKTILTNVSAIPTSFFVDRQGKIVSDVIVGANPNAYRDNLKRLTNKR